MAGCCAVFCLASLGAGIAIVKEGKLTVGQRNDPAKAVITANADPLAFHALAALPFVISVLCAVGVGLSLRGLRQAPKRDATRD